MNLRTTCFVRNENDELVNSHTFYSNDEQTLYAIANGFNFAMNRYCKNYKIKFTPIQINTFELDKED